MRGCQLSRITILGLNVIAAGAAASCSAISTPRGRAPMHRAALHYDMRIERDPETRALAGKGGMTIPATGEVTITLAEGAEIVSIAGSDTTTVRSFEVADVAREDGARSLGESEASEPRATQAPSSPNACSPRAQRCDRRAPNCTTRWPAQSPDIRSPY